MNTALVIRLIGGWTLTAGTIVVDANNTCIAGSCIRTGDAEVAVDGLWRFESGVEARWVSPTSALVRTKGGEWVPGTLTAHVAGPSPWAETPGQALSPSWDRGVLPGFWQTATYHCEEGTQAWIFNSLPALKNELVVRQGPKGPELFNGAEVVKCIGNFGGIWERKR